ncbi:hypothetical protein JB92DRAFT_2853994 [Gautieria morchelliformis]|nr:hypothetical protein JB92DRAFT_2853994 [Gautieria morchelliformis]
MSTAGMVNKRDKSTLTSRASATSTCEVLIRKRRRGVGFLPKDQKAKNRKWKAKDLSPVSVESEEGCVSGDEEPRKRTKLTREVVRLHSNDSGGLGSQRDKDNNSDTLSCQKLDVDDATPAVDLPSAARALARLTIFLDDNYPKVPACSQGSAAPVTKPQVDDAAAVTFLPTVAQALARLNNILDDNYPRVQACDQGLVVPAAELEEGGVAAASILPMVVHTLARLDNLVKANYHTVPTRNQGPAVSAAPIATVIPAVSNASNRTRLQAIQESLQDNESYLDLARQVALIDMFSGNVVLADTYASLRTPELRKVWVSKHLKIIGMPLE